LRFPGRNVRQEASVSGHCATKGTCIPQRQPNTTLNIKLTNINMNEMEVEMESEMKMTNGYKT
jgi:hypothetical protein